MTFIERWNEMKRKLQYHMDINNKWILREDRKDVIINQFNYFIIGLVYSICYTYKYDCQLWVHKRDGRICAYYARKIKNRATLEQIKDRGFEPKHLFLNFYITRMWSIYHKKNSIKVIVWINK